MKEENFNEYENSSIPLNKRKSLFSMIIVMAGFAIFSATIWVGADLANSFNMLDLILISIVGNLLLTIYISTLAYIGGETGLSTHKLSQLAFGRNGYKLTSMLALLGQFGWFAVGVMMFVDPVSNLLGINSEWLQFLMIMIVGLLMISSAFFGIKALEIVSMVSVPLVMIFGFIMMILVSLGVGDSSWNPNPSNPGSTKVFSAIGLVFATFVSGGTLVPDFVRWAKNGKQAVISVVVSFFICSTFMLLFGAFAYWGTGKSDLSDALVVLNLAIPGIIVLGANIWTTNDNSLYTQGLAASTIFGVEKKYAIVFLGVLATLLAQIINQHFIPFLDLLNLFLPGIGMIIIWNQLLLKEDNSEKSIDIIGIVSWIVGLLLAWVINTFLLMFILPIYVIIFTSVIYLICKYINRYISNKEKE